MSAGFSLAWYFYVSSEKAAVKFSLADEDRAMEGLANSCSWTECLCCRSNFMFSFEPYGSPLILSICGLEAAFQLGSAGLPSPVFASNPEPLQPLQLDLVQGRAIGMAGLPVLHPQHGLSVGCVLRLWQLLPPRRAFFPICQHAMRFLKLSLLDQQNRLPVVLKENSYWTIKPQLIIFLVAIVFLGFLFFFLLLLTVYLPQLPLPSPTGMLLFLMLLLKK